jgi:antitoxin component YwqK of YwqJK toxin-antitoxin module
MVDERYYNPENQLTGYRSLKRDREGRIAGEQNWSAAGELESRVAYSHDKQDRLQSETYYDPDGTRRGGCSYEYDAQGRIARRLMDASYSDGSRRSTETRYGYDAAGRLVEETYHDESLGGLALRITYAYVGGKRAYRSDYQRGRWLEFRSFFRYDDSGNVVEEVAYQIPESEDFTVYEPLTRPESFPQRLLSSRRLWEYTYFQGQSP